MSEDDRTLFVGGLSDRVTEELLYELFLQAGPLEKVKIPTDKEGRSRRFAFVTFLHDVSVPYSKQVMDGIQLFGRTLSLQNRGSNSNDSPRSSPRSSPHYNSDPQQNRHPGYNRANTWHGQTSPGQSPQLEGPSLMKSPPYEVKNLYAQAKGGYMSVDVLRGQSSAGSMNDMSMQPREMAPIDVRRQRVLDKQQMSMNIQNQRGHDNRYDNRDGRHDRRGRYDDHYNRSRSHHPYDNERRRGRY
ncbi:hypothetical protein LOTGIDRAFT_233621 [Lottia gigantea]|uniref:RRM domain-containing protein n=1 Tax=Lottia gigantea TaxID=225164 RepID=V4A1Q2_LOTGI|nr:hypothetical protein LOTGIDRAFT_233621 [Lottia gigantea]ESO90602.1 hypothetical protein LOTGIDRAFT_233621 [Lottia gigantea]